MSAAAKINRETLDLTRLRKGQGHKYDHGHALVLSGGPGRTGAARLAARAALRIGAGAVTIGVPPNAEMEVAGQVTAVMLARISDTRALEHALQDKRINALCVGPGFGLAEEHAEILRVALKSGKPCVVDADAITLIARDKALFNGLHENCVLTPHFGEFQRLFGELPQSRLETLARSAAESCGAIVLLKGPKTYVSGGQVGTAVHEAVGDRAVPWLATAGAGDVLAGIIAGLMARGFSPFDAACFGAWLHVETARHFGPGLIAEDLPEKIPDVLRHFGC